MSEIQYMSETQTILNMISCDIKSEKMQRFLNYDITSKKMQQFFNIQAFRQIIFNQLKHQTSKTKSSPINKQDFDLSKISNNTIDNKLANNLIFEITNNPCKTIDFDKYYFKQLDENQNNVLFEIIPSNLQVQEPLQNITISQEKIYMLVNKKNHPTIIKYNSLKRKWQKFKKEWQIYNADVVFIKNLIAISITDLKQELSYVKQQMHKMYSLKQELQLQATIDQQTQQLNQQQIQNQQQHQNPIDENNNETVIQKEQKETSKTTSKQDDNKQKNNNTLQKTKDNISNINSDIYINTIINIYNIY